MTLIDVLAFTWFCLCYFGYAWAVRYGPLKSRRGLVAAVNDRRAQWMETALRRDIRIMDAQLSSLSSETPSFPHPRPFSCSADWRPCSEPWTM